MPRAKQPNLVRIHLVLDKTLLARLDFYFSANIGRSEAIRIAIADMLADNERRAKQLLEGE